MAKYKSFIKKSTADELENISKKDLKHIVKRIQSLAENPRPRGSQKLSTQERYRIRQGNYRIVYSIQDKELAVQIFKIGHRREINRSKIVR
jgi:mRNA interferase RelE/StbE